MSDAESNGKAAAYCERIAGEVGAAGGGAAATGGGAAGGGAAG